ncbi:hypothetical protein AQJ46_33905 [Streptomyces canus]|uniref:Uncharacterized protein n=1 Tax=Streptomyces canus TaxID=58343 RepID=A0A117QZ67_9ACTN|nr:hypothetical protein AQJ46_33905 [Streptomyces canus]
MFAQLAHDPHVLGAGRRRDGAAEVPGAVRVEKVLLGDAHDPRLRRRGSRVASVDGRRQSGTALSVAGCTMTS